MSPRSEEFLAEARVCLSAAAALLEREFPTRSVHESYYAVLYAARAALSERDQQARTHRGTWHLFRLAFVETGQFEVGLYDRAQRAQSMREDADYDAAGFAPEEAQQLMEDAGRFVDATAAMLGD